MHARPAHPSLRAALVASFVLARIGLAGCTSSDPTGSSGGGTAAFSTYGEGFIEKEIPAAAVEDGWTVKYSKFLVVFRSIKIATTTGMSGAEMKGSKLFDMAKPGQKLIAAFPGLAARSWDHVSYEMGPIAEDTDATGATDADKQLMLRDKLSIYLEATGTKGADVKALKWAFATNTLFDRCEGELNGKKTAGVVVTNGGTDSVELTVHGDHFFYDDLQADNAKVRFGNVAASDVNDDGVVTLEELAQKKLVDIPTELGAYGTGGAGGINDLRAFVTALARTIGHYRGEGECFAKPLP